jgi:glutamyl-tRNA synthetase
MENIRVRFAPSPTGKLHIGNARTAMFNYLLAKKYNGKFVLRIEDTDFERSTKESEISILKDLKWLGLSWDEGPDVGGENGPYRQSERFDIYKRFTEKLLSEGKAYKCFCTPEEIEEMRKECTARGTQPKYNGKCRNLTKEQTEQLEKQGKKYSVRFKVNEGINIIVDDLIRGKVEFNSSNIGGDFIIVRSDGVPVYNYIVVIDDYLMKITHVVRGDDHLSNTPKQILVAKALGLSLPKYAHHALILGPDRAKLSKRHGITSVSNYRDEGYLPEALFNYLSLLGWSSETGEEILSKEQLIKEVDLSRVGKSAAIFDFKKLRWINSLYIRNLDNENLLKLLTPFIEQNGYRVDDFDKNWLLLFVETIKGNLEILSEIKQWLPMFFDEAIEYEEDCRAIIENDLTENLITSFKANIENTDIINKETYVNVMKSVMKETGVKGKKLFMPVRVLTTGKTKGPDLDKTLILLGKDKIIHRIENFLQKNK